jgi:hypothetical protein
MNDRRGKARLPDPEYLMLLHWLGEPIPRELIARVFQETTA